MRFNNNLQFKTKNSSGFTLVEVLVASFLFAGLALGTYQAFVSLNGLAQSAKLKSVAMALANEQLEIARNLPYSEVGILNGWPAGKIPREKRELRNNFSFLITTTIRNIDDPFDGTIGGTPNDLSPADYKLVAVEIKCLIGTGNEPCRYYQSVTLSTFVAPKNLETSSGHGALFIRALDANGQAIPSANVKITNRKSTSTIIIQDQTNDEGLLALVDLPPGQLAYRVEISKSGYSSARTYAEGEVGMENPVSPDATVLAGQLTQLSLVIDRLSEMEISVINQYCAPVGPFSLVLKGSKVLDNEGQVFIYEKTHTVPSSGLFNLANLVWDTYTFTPADSNLMIVGSFPLQSVLVPPGALAEVRLLVAPRSGRGLLVSVKDGASSLPLSDASVTLRQSEDERTLSTSRGFFRQVDWSSGSYETDGRLELNQPAGELKLQETFGQYVGSGYLVSQVFDAGTASTTFYSLLWSPFDQATSTGVASVRFQLATSNDSATSTWNFVGPDGTAGTFYTKTNNNINSLHNNQRYLRYKVFLQTANPAYSPNLSEIAITYSSECLPFGQIFFSDLGAGDYEVEVTKTGYQTHYSQVDISSDWQILEIVLNPE